MDFIQIADDILNHKILFLPNKNKTYRIYEIEMYYCNDQHKDLYTHCHPLQLENGSFYLHRLPNKVSFKEGTYKCMDYTLGDKNTNTYFGVLIRAMIDVQTGEFYAGPCICVNQLFSHYQENDSSMTSKLFSEKYNINEEFKLLPCTLNILPLLHGPRIGLNNEKYPEFRNKNYRFVTYTKYIKEKNTVNPITS